MVSQVNWDLDARHSQVLLNSQRSEDEHPEGLGLKLWLLNVNFGWNECPVMFNNVIIMDLAVYLAEIT